MEAMLNNGSPAAEFEFDEDRSYFMVRLPVHPAALEVEAETTPQDTPLVKPKVTGQVTGQVKHLLTVLKGDMSRGEIQKTL